MSSPPGFSTRTKSFSVPSGSGTAVMTYCATTASKEESAKASFVRPAPRVLRKLDSRRRARPLLRLANHRLENPAAADPARAQIARRGPPGTAPDSEKPPADPVRFSDRRLAAMIEHLA